jgi:hypothetical protein
MRRRPQGDVRSRGGAVAATRAVGGPPRPLWRKPGLTSGRHQFRKVHARSRRAVSLAGGGLVDSRCHGSAHITFKAGDGRQSHTNHDDPDSHEVSRGGVGSHGASVVRHRLGASVERNCRFIDPGDERPGPRAAPAVGHDGAQAFAHRKPCQRPFLRSATLGCVVPYAGPAWRFPEVRRASFARRKATQPGTCASLNPWSRSGPWNPQERNPRRYRS